MGTSSAFVEKPLSSPVPFYADGPARELLLGFPDWAVARLKKNSQLYFVSWSMNWTDETAFRKAEIRVFDEGRLEKARVGEDLVKVSVEGPYDLSSLTDDYSPFSSFKTIQDAQQRIKNWETYWSPVMKPMTLRLWRAVKA